MRNLLAEERPAKAGWEMPAVLQINTADFLDLWGVCICVKCLVQHLNIAHLIALLDLSGNKQILSKSLYKIPDAELS